MEKQKINEIQVNEIQVVEINVNCPNYECATKIANSAITKKLAACANLIKNVESIYRWKGEIVKDNEVLLLLKTSTNTTQRLIKDIMKIHTDEVPAITVKIPQQVNHEYQKWVLEQTK